MMKMILASLCAAFAITASATPNQPVQKEQTTVAMIQAIQHQVVLSQIGTMGLNWRVNDTANYNMKMGFIQGKMVMKVASIGPEGIWMHQDVDLGFLGQQQAQILLDQNTGAIKKMIVNGQEQQVPEQDLEIISTEQVQVTVPAGTFDAIYVLARSNNEELKMWVNPNAVPLSGMIKQVSPSQLGEVVVELTSFSRG